MIMFNFFANLKNQRRESSELDQLFSKLVAFNEVLRAGYLVAIPMGVQIRRWAEKRVENRLSPHISSSLDTHEFFNFLSKVVDALPNPELELLHAELAILSSPKISGLWRDAFDADDPAQRKEFTQGLSHFILASWVFCKLKVKMTKSEKIKRKASEIEDLLLFHMTKLVQMVKGE
jgi:hypothetical protein